MPPPQGWQHSPVPGQGPPAEPCAHSGHLPWGPSTCLGKAWEPCSAGSSRPRASGSQRGTASEGDTGASTGVGNQAAGLGADQGPQCRMRGRMVSRGGIGMGMGIGIG